MIEVIVMGSLAVSAAYFARFKTTIPLLKVSFIIIFIFLALRYDFGNDYFAYYEIFNEVNWDFTAPNLFDGSIYGEVGWLILCSLFKPFGFFTMVAVLALFNCIVYYRFIKEYVAPKWYWLAIFIYVFTPGFLLVHLSAMRQSLAIAIFILSIEFIVRRKIIPYILCIIFASFFHNSALILLPFYFIYSWKLRFTVGGSLLVLIIYVALFIFRNTLTPYVGTAIAFFFNKYDRLLGTPTAEIGSGLGTILNGVLLMILILYAKNQNPKSSVVVKLAVVSFFFIPLSLMFDWLTRSAMYFLPAIIVIFPMTFGSIKDAMLHRVIVAVFILFTFYQFYGFFTSEIFRKSYENYQTIIPYL